MVNFSALTLLCYGALILFGISLFQPVVADDNEIADADRGRILYNRCRACHALQDDGKKRMGPHLENIFGRKIAAAEGFRYSKALSDANIVWSAKDIDTWLLDPNGYLPGNRMTFAGMPDPKDRRDLIAYLRTATEQNTKD